MRRAVRRPSRAALVTDVLLYAVVALPTVVALLIPTPGDAADRWSRAAGLVVLAAAVAVCRAWPTAAMLTAIALTAVHGTFVFAMPVLAYLTGLRTSRARPPLWGFTAVLVGGAALSVAAGVDVAAWFPVTVWLVLIGVLPWLVGRYWRQYRELLRAGWERADRLEHQQRIVAERERLRERARIAQDMHDTLGHELALIAVRAGALQVTPGLAEEHRAAAAQLRGDAAQATDHLREIIGVLREATGTTGTATGAAPDPDVESDLDVGGAAPVRPAREGIAELVERARASGVPVHLVTGETGESDTAAAVVEGALPPMAAHAAHRVVQEAVTNAAKHAPGAAVTVRLTRHAATGTTTVTVANGPPPDDPSPALAPSSPGGYGLAGLTERLRLLGGTLDAAPTPTGGFQVTARIPATPRPAPPAEPEPDPAPSGDHPEAGEWTSESARHLDRVRRQVRRGLITAIAVPAALMAVLGAVMAGYYVYVTLNSVLAPGDYAALRVGDPQVRVTRVLPPMETMSADVVRRAVPEPAGADCRYYRPDADLLGTGSVYRLCFTAGRLAAKDSYDTATLSPPTTGGDAP